MNQLKELNQANKAKKVIQIVRALLLKMCHDFSQPLGTAMMSASCLKNQDSPARHTQEAINDGVNLLTLYRSLLTDKNLSEKSVHTIIQDYARYKHNIFLYFEHKLKDANTHFQDWGWMYVITSFWVLDTTTPISDTLHISINDQGCQWSSLSLPDYKLLDELGWGNLAHYLIEAWDGVFCHLGDVVKITKGPGTPS